MFAPAVDANSPKVRTRPVRKSPTPKSESKAKVGLHLSAESARRLAVFAAMEGVDRSQVVDELIRSHLRKYIVQTRADRANADDQAIPAMLEGSAI